MSNNFQHWRYHQDADSVVWLSFDKADSVTNTFDSQVLFELEQILDTLATNHKLNGLVITSAKKKGFIAGADIESFKSLTSADQVKSFLQHGHDVFRRLEQLPFPTVALINGFCLGGGSELVLACDYRIMLDDDSARIGLPEVMLGIHPGWGGTIRLPRIIGPLAAMDLMLTGRSLRPRAAKKVGFVDDIVPQRQLIAAAKYFINRRPAKRRASWLQRAMNWSPVRRLLANVFEKKVKANVRKDHYPAPYAIIDTWQRHGVYGSHVWQSEINSVVKLVTQDDTVKNLVRVFFLQERMKAFAKASDFRAQHVHVIGAGVMGGDIAAWCALKGCTVTLNDQSAEAIAKAVGRANQLFAKKLKDPRQIAAANDRLVADLSGDGVSKADVIIEAIVEKVEIKQKVFADIEQRAKPSAILATNTSSIPLDAISQVMKNPERLVGIHFFNPVAKMPLVEVVRGAKTSAKVCEQVFSFVRQIDRSPLPVKSSPGFLVNRVLMPYLMECMTLLQEGIPAEYIDKAAVTFGMPMGPVELADTVGLDVCLSVAQNLTESFGGSVPPELFQMVQKGQLGKKTGKGFYRYVKGKAQKKSANDWSSVKLDATTIANRLVMRIILESFHCLNEGVVEDADLLDAGMIYGTGFAPFRGGPMQYAQTLGRTKIVKLANELANAYGDRFRINDDD